MSFPTVYCVLRGEQNEGGTLVSVHASRLSAKLAALSEPRCFDSEPWEPVDGATDVWENGCDFVEVVEREILS